MTISVIVPTYNRANQIITILEALENQTFRDFETIVVNDGSTDNTLTNLSSFKEKTKLDLKIYSIVNRGRAGCRNHGIEKAEGDLIIFFDDDTRPNPESVANHYSCHQRLPNILVSGPCLYETSKFTHEFSYFRQWMESKWIINSQQLIVSNNLRINGGNFSIMRNNLLRIGGFDERLRDKEDFKLAFDFKDKLSGDILYFYPAWVYHDDFNGLLGYIEREKSSRHEEQKLELLEPRIGMLFPERFQTQMPKGFKYQFGRLLRVKVIIRLLEKILDTPYLKRTAKNKIYDVVVTMNVKYL